MTTGLLICGIVGALGFLIVFTVDGATRPQYRATYHPVSALAMGPRGRLQTVNFILAGSLIAAAAVGIRLVLHPGPGDLVTPLIAAVVGLTLAGSGVFTMDPMRQYPPGTPPGDPSAYSTAHTRHDQLGAIMFSALATCSFAFAWTFWRSPTPEGPAAWYSLVSGSATAILFIWFGQAWERDAPRTGLIQRAALTVGMVWFAVTCLLLIPNTGS